MKTKSITKVTLLSIFVMAFVTAVTLNSCQKEAIKPKSKTTTSSAALEQMSPTSPIFTQANGMLFSMMTNHKSMFMPNFRAFDSSGCVSIVVDTIGKPHTATYDYGSGCIGSDGRLRAGQVIYSFDNSDIRLVNNVWSISFNNFSLNSDLFNGGLVITNNGTNGNGNLVISEVGGIIHTYNNNGTTTNDTISPNLSYEWIAGENSSPLQNLQFKITGNGTFSSTSGQTGNMTITSPLIKNYKTSGCNYFIQGTISMSNGANTLDLDYGNPGGCSGQFQAVENGVTSIRQQ